MSPYVKVTVCIAAVTFSGKVFAKLFSPISSHKEITKSKESTDVSFNDQDDWRIRALVSQQGQHCGTSDVNKPTWIND